MEFEREGNEPLNELQRTHELAERLGLPMGTAKESRCIDFVCRDNERAKYNAQIGEYHPAIATASPDSVFTPAPSPQMARASLNVPQKRKAPASPDMAPPAKRPTRKGKEPAGGIAGGTRSAPHDVSAGLAPDAPSLLHESYASAQHVDPEQSGADLCMWYSPMLETWMPHDFESTYDGPSKIVGKYKIITNITRDKVRIPLDQLKKSTITTRR